ncbi:hypothetical protein Hanom_Chr13g01223421 [Helianthus anomalus]
MTPKQLPRLHTQYPPRTLFQNIQRLEVKKPKKKKKEPKNCPTQTQTMNPFVYCTWTAII